MTARRLLLALFVALLFSSVFTYWLSRRMATTSRKTGHARYVAAARGLEPGQVISSTDLQRIDWPSNTPLEGATQKPEEVTNRMVVYPIAKGQPILQRQLAAPGMIGLATKIPAGMRAVSLKSDQVVGVAGFLLPGTHTDVLVTYRPNGSDEPTTATVLQNAEILAAGQNTEPDPRGKPTTVNVVTLLVNPFDAERVVLASTQGTIHFVLRNGTDSGQVAERPALISELGGAKDKAPVRVAARKAAPVVKPYTVEVLRGDKHTVESFQ